MPYARDYGNAPLLTSLSVAYRANKFVAEELFPRVTVDTQEGKFPVFGREVFIVEDTIRSPKTESNEMHYSVGTTTYNCKHQALKYYVSQDERDTYPGSDEAATINVTKKVLLKQESDLATYACTTGTYNASNTTTLTGTNQWSDAANSDPIGDIWTGKTAIMKSLGEYPNTMIVGGDAWAKFAAHPDIREELKYTTSAITRPEDIAMFFGFTKVIVAPSISNTALEGATETMAFLWGDNCVLAYVTPSPGRNELSYGYMLDYGGRQVRTWYDEDRNADAIEVEECYDYKLGCVDTSSASIAGYLIYDCIA